jgi:hypothetical protein
MKLEPLVLAFALVAAAVLAGCITRSISNSDFDNGPGRYRNGNPQYQGELSEFDVLGIDRSKLVSNEEISQTLGAHKPLAVKRGSSVMVIQSGAAFPDQPMLKAFGKYYAVGLFTGVPPVLNGTSPPNTAESYSQALRLAAARGGYETLIVYWGILESARENLATSSVSWVPVVGWLLPDERQRMRIRLKIAIVDVRSGQWEMFAPEPFDDSAISAMLSRKQADQQQVAVLKDLAYAAAAEDLVKRYGG